MKDISKITEDEMAIVMEHDRRAKQLHNIRRVMNGSITPKKLKQMEQLVLPEYILRERNARAEAERVMIKYGMALK